MAKTIPNFPTMLVILDGFGYRAELYGNAIAHAHMPFWRWLLSKYPNTLLNASGLAVGLLQGYIGNSEVGHLTLGAGRIIDSPLKQLSDAINSGEIYTNRILIQRLRELKASNKRLHLIGLLSDAGVHSHQDHLYALIKLAKQYEIEQVYIHTFLDGRDTRPYTAENYLQQLENFCNQIAYGTIASIQGRFYAMDRDHNWERTKISYDVLCGQKSQKVEQLWSDIINQIYQQKQSEEFLYPTLLVSDGAIQQGDGIIFFNFRPDRARQLTEAFINPSFTHFSNPYNAGNQCIQFFITPFSYQESFKRFNYDVLFEQEQIIDTLLDSIACQQNNPPVFIIGESEKYAQVTYFFNGMCEQKLPNQTRILIPSLKETNYEQRPEMSAAGITNTLIHSLRNDPAYFYLVNYANADMVGHSGNFHATVKACEVIDQQLALLYHEVVERHNGILCITADHGNAEEKIDAHGKRLTAHTTNKVPFVLINTSKSIKNVSLTDNYGLANVAPTILRCMGLSIPEKMTSGTIF